MIIMYELMCGMRAGGVASHSHRRDGSGLVCAIHSKMPLPGLLTTGMLHTRYNAAAITNL